MKNLRIIALSVILSSCMLDEATDISFPPSNDRLFVESFIKNDEKLTLKLLEVNRFEGNMALELVYNAKVWIIYNSGSDSIKLDNIVNLSSTDKISYNYVNATKLRFSANDVIQLKIKVDNYPPIYGSSSIVESIDILDYKVTENYTEITCPNSFRSDHRYYYVHTTEYKDTEAKYYQELFDFSTVDDNIISMRVDRSAAPYDSMHIHLTHINQDLYRYHLSSENARASNVDPSVAPELIKSNLSSGVGIFTYSTEDIIKVN